MGRKNRKGRSGKSMAKATRCGAVLLPINKRNVETMSRGILVAQADYIEPKEEGVKSEV